MKASREFKNYVNRARRHCVKSPYNARNGVVPIAFFDHPEFERKDGMDKKWHTFDDEMEWEDEFYAKAP